MISERDEYLHLKEAPDPKALFTDSLGVWLIDRQANICGINHISLTNHGYGRYSALYIIDGVQQLYGNKHPIPEDPGHGPWSDGRLTYQVVKPLQEIRITFDGLRYAFDLTFTGRFPVFDYDDCYGGNPFDVIRERSPAGAGERPPVHFAGHQEQALDCRGTFEIRAGPRKGERRELRCWAHRDHSWSHRWHQPIEWDWPSAGSFPGHFWAVIQLPDRQINAMGPLEGGQLPLGRGGFVCTAQGNTPLRDTKGEVLLADDGRTAMAFRLTLTLLDGQVIHVRTGRKYGQTKLWYRGDDDLENPADCLEPFFDWEVEETGERGDGVCEYSIHPPRPRWLV